MLFARCVSDAIRSIAPQVSAGRYTPEELEDMDDNRSYVRQNVDVQSADQPERSYRRQTVEIPTEVPKTQEQPKKDPVVENAKVEPEKSDDVKSDQPVQRVHISDPITADQDTKIRKLIVELKSKHGITVAPGIKDILQSKGMNSLADLTIESADCLIRALEKKELEAWANSQITGHKDAFSQAK